ncbi:RrF2 family transcriptional regulator [Taibaiella soli]|uniref:Transcriptional regulator n=1 Tax=Taibaiella soli TaxID=1649169 RepID=A0A2W2AJ72_9BACT|nr:Rrf2 family transcriptional regulator [Taibaiella soli]PZF72300.1 transcriptional regulator [Taibaiella soli]
MNNGRFATSIHILTLLEQAGEELLSSEYLASSININPVLVRKEVSNLRNHGLVATKEGKNGGSYLAKPAAQIKLADVYKAVRNESLLGYNKNEPNPACPVGRQINQHLDELYDIAELAVLQKLGNITLAEFCHRFK